MKPKYYSLHLGNNSDYILSLDKPVKWSTRKEFEIEAI